MPRSNIFTFPKPMSYITLGFWLIIVFIAVSFLIRYALPYYGFDPEYFGRYLDFKWTLMGHISGGLLALIIGPFQFWKAFRNRYLKAHRWMGRTYLVAILVGTLSSSVLAWTVGLKFHWTWSLALQGLALAWISTAAMAYISIRRGEKEKHRQWMIKSYIVTFAFVSFRWMDELPALRALGGDVERSASLIWVSWAIPLLITEVIFQLKKGKK